MDLFPDKCGFLKDSALFLLINDHPGCIMDPNTMSSAGRIETGRYSGFLSCPGHGVPDFPGAVVKCPASDSGALGAGIK